MTISDLTKQLFKLMTKHGDLEVVGDFEIKDEVLHLKQVGVGEDESQVLDFGGDGTIL